MCAVDAVASRKWDDGSEVKLVAVTEPTVPRAIGRFVSPAHTRAAAVADPESLWLEQAARIAIDRLRGAGMGAELSVHSGNPKEILVEEAERWGADCIFVGATVYGSAWERVLLGSTAAAVAARAHCSVEVVRDRKSGRSSQGDPK